MRTSPAARSSCRPSVRLGRTDEALRVSENYQAVADAKGQPWARARARRCRGLVLAEGFDAAFEEALELHAETLDVFETARTALAYGERLRRSGRRVEAREQLRRALTTFAELGAEPWADRRPSSSTSPGNGCRLARWAASRRSPRRSCRWPSCSPTGVRRREAAAALFLSPKTVEYHLRKVYAQARRALARAAGRGRVRGLEVAAGPLLRGARPPGDERRRARARGRRDRRAERLGLVGGVGLLRDDPVDDAAAVEVDPAHLFGARHVGGVVEARCMIAQGALRQEGGRPGLLRGDHAVGRQERQRPTAEPSPSIRPGSGARG